MRSSLASNRRVEHYASNAGNLLSESVRQYPFNAADSLTLLDTNNTNKKPVRHTARKKAV